MHKIQHNMKNVIHLQCLGYNSRKYLSKTIFEDLKLGLMQVYGPCTHEKETSPIKVIKDHAMI